MEKTVETVESENKYYEEFEERKTWEKIKLTNAKSEVWNYFSMFANGKYPNVSICDLCEMEFSMGNSRSTSSMRNHLKRRHINEIPDSLKFEKPPCCYDSNESTKKRKVKEVENNSNSFLQPNNNLIFPTIDEINTLMNYNNFLCQQLINHEQIA